MFHVTDRPQKLLNKRAHRLCEPDRSLLKIAGLCFVLHLRVVVWYFAWDLELIAFGSWNLPPQAALPRKSLLSRRSRGLLAAAVPRTRTNHPLDHARLW